MDTFDKWFNRFLWGTDIVLLAASTPHIAAWYTHFDNPTVWYTTLYAWLVGYGLAIAIDGVSIMLLYALIRMIRTGQKGKGAMAGLVVFMAAIAGLSWFVNWQYDLTNASVAFAKADATTLHIWRAQVTVGALNPVIGGAFSLLMLAYALISRVVKTDVAPVMTDEQFEMEKRRVARANQLKELRRGKGFIAQFRDTAIESKSAWQAVRDSGVPDMTATSNTTQGMTDTRHDSDTGHDTTATPEMTQARQDDDIQHDTETPDQTTTRTPQRRQVTRQSGTTSDKIVSYRRRHPDATQSEIATAVGCSVRTVQRHDKPPLRIVNE